MDRAVYPPYVLISILVDGLAAVTIVLTLNPSFFDQRAVSERLPVRVRLLTSLPMLDSKPMKTHPEAQPSRGSDTSPPSVVKFSPPPQRMSPLSMTRPVPPALQVLDNTRARIGSGTQVLPKNLKRQQSPAVRIVVAKNDNNPARRSIPLTELQIGKPRPLRTILKTPEACKPAFLASSGGLKPLQGTRIAPARANQMTQDLRYRGYRYAIWKKIDKHLFYPQAAANGKASGRVVVRFEVTRDGQLATLELLQGSGMAVRKAAPLPPKFPPAIAGNRIAIRGEILI